MAYGLVVFLSRLGTVNLDAPTRLAWLNITVALAFAANLLFSSKLWVSSRAYPLAPVWDSFPRIPFPWDYLCLTVLFVLFFLIVLESRPRPYLIACVCLLIVYSLWDQARWTPPVYQYTFMLAALSFHSWRHSERSNHDSILNTCRVIIAGTYFWAGAQKVNITFMSEVFPWMLKPFVGPFPVEFRDMGWLLGLVAALTEAGIGVGLLLPATRQAAVVAAITMHGFVLLSIGPVGHWWDTNVWPWNIATPVLAVLLFWRVAKPGVAEVLVPRHFRFQWVAVVLFVLMPSLNFIGLWDDYLSAAFYSGNIRHGVIQMTGQTKAMLPEEIRRHVRPNRSGMEVLDLMRWAFAVRNVEPYPETRVFKATARELCRYSEDSSGMTLVIHEKPNWRTGRREVTRYTCADLGGSNGVIARARLS